MTDKQLDFEYNNLLIKTFNELTEKYISNKALSIDKNKLHTFTVEEDQEEHEYVGFQCDGDQRYFLSNGILTHNTQVMLKCAVAAATGIVESGSSNCVADSQQFRSNRSHTVGIYSGEMVASKVGYRIDSLISHISNYSISKGKDDVAKEYHDYIEDLKNGLIKGSIKILTPNDVGGPVGVNALRAFIEKEKLDILFIDQHSLLEDDRHGKTPIEKASNISKDLKLLQVTKKIPIIAVSQQNRNSTEEKEVDVSNIAQSDRIGQDSTTVLALEKQDGVLTMHLVKSRDSISGKKLQYAIDFDKETYEYIPTEVNGDEVSAQKVQELKNKYDIDGEGDLL